jgi:sRNA-binding carbon storage regulator CsrA
MLNITRKPKNKYGRSIKDDQHIVKIITPSGELIVIEVLECRPGCTKLGFIAPKEYEIQRGEWDGK